MKSADGLTPRQRKVWNAMRFLVPGKLRWFYEGHPAMRGQLWYQERKLLYTTIMRCRPRVCFEIGTWKGGGSTLFIGQALHDIGGGLLHTIEMFPEIYAEALENHRRYLPHLSPYIAFHQGDYRTVYAPLLNGPASVDFLLLDGAENAEETLAQYKFFLPAMKVGSVLMAHDWFTTKCALLQSEIQKSGAWDITRVLTPPRSVGFMMAVRRNR